MSPLGRLSIKSKLLVMMLGVSAASIAVVAWLGYRSGEASLRQAAFNHLTSLRASKADQIESYFRALRGQVGTLGEDHTVGAAALRFREAFRGLRTAEVPRAWDARLERFYRDEFLPRLARNLEGEPVLEGYLPEGAAARLLQYRYIVANPNPVGEKQRLDAPGDEAGAGAAGHERESGAAGDEREAAAAGGEAGAGAAGAYDRAHATYHPFFRKLAAQFGFYDLFLVDPETGDVVYTVFKETDFATNLLDGAHAGSNLARAVAAVRRSPDRDFVQLVDFEAYRPSYAVPAAFMATPVFEGEHLVGILAVQVSVAEIDRIMTGGRQWEREGLGRSGETYLVGPDQRMRSNSRFLLEDPEGFAANLREIGTPEDSIRRILELGTTILQQTVRTEASLDALAGKSGTRAIRDYRGVPVLSSFAPLRVRDLDWAVLSEIDLDEAYAPIRRLTREVVLSTVLILLAVTVVVMGLASSFVRPVHELIARARRVGSGEIEVAIESSSEDEFGELAASFRQVLEGMRSEARRAAEANRENEDLLQSILPAPVARRLKAGEQHIADTHSSVTVLFSDLEGFTALTRALPARQAVALLDAVVSAFDEAAERHGVEKIKTVGDGYMAACGLSTPRLDHARRAVEFALEMARIVERLSREHGRELALRVGLASGPVVAGIIGRNKFLYDVWGETVNRASRARSAAGRGELCVTPEVHEKLHDLYPFERAAVPASEGSEAAFFVLRFAAGPCAAAADAV
jgi:class 3 adenylate cyclase